MASMFFAIFTRILNFLTLFVKNYPLCCVLSHKNGLGGIKMPERGLRRSYRKREDYQPKGLISGEKNPGGRISKTINIQTQIIQLI
jgi:hypothetical protein